MSISISTILIAAITGIIPALVWLWFWLQEDWQHPEPKRLLGIAFLGGVLAVVASFFAESWFARYAPTESFEFIAGSAFIEEFFVLLITGIFVLRSRHVDEPIDYAIYLGTAGLGFAAFENILFLIDPVASLDILATIFTSNSRFLGATLLHGLTGAIMGIAIGHAIKFTSHRRGHMIAGTVYGLILATVLHATFNLSIITSTPTSQYAVIAGLWLVGFLVIYALHKLKRSSQRWNPHRK